MQQNYFKVSIFTFLLLEACLFFTLMNSLRISFNNFLFQLIFLKFRNPFSLFQTSFVILLKRVLTFLTLFPVSRFQAHV